MSDAKLNNDAKLNDKKTYESGAQRSKDNEADQYGFHLLHPIPLMRMAAVFKKAAYERYGPHNYEAGLSIQDCIDHMWTHYFKWRMNIQDGEDHLAHFMTNAYMIMVLEQTHPELMKGIKWDGFKISSEMTEVWKEIQAKLKEKVTQVKLEKTNWTFEKQIIEFVTHNTENTSYDYNLRVRILWAHYCDQNPNSNITREEFFDIIESSFDYVVISQDMEPGINQRRYIGSMDQRPMSHASILHWIYSNTKQCKGMSVNLMWLADKYEKNMPIGDGLKFKQIIQRLFDIFHVGDIPCIKDRISNESTQVSADNQTVQSSS